MKEVNRHVVPKILSADGVSGVALLSVYSDRVTVESFEHETEMTDFIQYPVAILSRENIDEFLLDDIDVIVSSGWNEGIERRLDDYFRSSGLYSSGGRAGSVAVMLKPIGCELLG